LRKQNAFDERYDVVDDQCSKSLWLKSMNVMFRLIRLVMLSGGSLPRNRQSSARMTGRPRLLVLGVYLGLKANHVKHLVEQFSSAKLVDVEQRWVCMMGEPSSGEVEAVTVRKVNTYLPKWQQINELIGSDDLERFDYVVVCDDDILLGPDFVDYFIAEQQSLGFALAQPARTWRSWADHPIVRRKLFMRARQTNFVESGPLVSFRKDFFKAVYPFSLDSPMGWGYDLNWPILARERGLAIGIIDSTPVDHSLRGRGSLYDMRSEFGKMADYLSTRQRVSETEMTRAIRNYR
jgi:hypothetical protein